MFISDVSVLADIPLDDKISSGSDNGIPVVISSPDGPQVRKVFNDLHFSPLLVKSPIYYTDVFPLFT